MQALRRFHVAILIPTLLVLAALGLAWVLTSSAAQGVTSSRTAATPENSLRSCRTLGSALVLARIP